MGLPARSEQPVLPVRELAVFLIFGGLAALTNLLVGWQLYGTGLFPHLPYWCATAIAATSGLFVNFGLNYAFNFKYRQRSALQQFSTFCIVALIGVGITSALSNSILSILNMYVGPVFYLSGVEVRSVFAAHFGAVGLTVLYSFPAHKCMSFNVGIRAQLQHVFGQISERT
jgi:putative flippase GtrA